MIYKNRNILAREQKMSLETLFDSVGRLGAREGLHSKRGY